MTRCCMLVLFTALLTACNKTQVIPNPPISMQEVEESVTKQLAKRFQDFSFESKQQDFHANGDFTVHIDYTANGETKTHPVKLVKSFEENQRPRYKAEIPVALFGEKAVEGIDTFVFEVREEPAETP